MENQCDNSLLCSTEKFSRPNFYPFGVKSQEAAASRANNATM